MPFEIYHVKKEVNSVYFYQFMLQRFLFTSYTWGVCDFYYTEHKTIIIHESLWRLYKKKDTFAACREIISIIIDMVWASQKVCRKIWTQTLDILNVVGWCNHGYGSFSFCLLSSLIDTSYGEREFSRGELDLFSIRFSGVSLWSNDLGKETYCQTSVESM